MEELTSITYWHWLILGLALMILELLSFTAILLWAGAAAFVTALLAYLLPSSTWQMQGLCFAISTAVLLLVTRQWIQKTEGDSRPSLNRRADNLIGQVYTIDEPISHGQGRVNIHDTLWQLTGPDAPTGASIKVIAVVDNVLKVELDGH